MMTFLFIAALIWILFLGARPDESTRRALGGWLRGEEVDWAASFLGWFDRVFRVRRVTVLGSALHLPSLGRSIAASCLSLLVLAIMWVFHKETLSRPLRYEGIDAIPDEQISILLLVYGGATLVTNWIPDYVSLVQSRWVIGRVAKTRSPLARIAWVGVDAALTLGIAFGGIVLGGLVILPFVANHLTIEIGCFTSETFTLSAAWEIFTSGLAFETPPATLNYDAAGIYIYSTLLTSIWLWLYLAGGLLMRALGSLVPGAHRLSNQPMPALALGAFLSFSGTYWPIASFIAERSDVRIEGAGSEALEHALEAEGLSVTSRGSASLVVLLPSAPPEARERAEAETACGARPYGSVFQVVPEHGRDVVEWAKHAPSILGRDQVAECRSRMGLAPLPPCP